MEGSRAEDNRIREKDTREKNNEEEHRPVNDFQESVNNLLVRHKSIMDCLTKFQESTARVNRAIAKTVTWCGCITVNAGRQKFPEEITLKDFHKYLESHLQGELCQSCQEVIEEEVGNHLFYLAALCNLLGLDLNRTLDQELNRLHTLGHFYLC